MKDRIKFPAQKTKLWAVYEVYRAFGLQRQLVAAFGTKEQADEYADEHRINNRSAETMVEEIDCVIPAWDGTVED